MDLLDRLANALYSPKPRKCYACRREIATVPKSAGGRAVFCSVEHRDSWEQTMREW